MRIHQPKVATGVLARDRTDSGRSFTWMSITPGVRVMGRHCVEATPTGYSVTLSIRYEGMLSAWLARWTGDLNERCLSWKQTI